MIYQGSCLTVLRERFADESVQCCVTSPPYWGLRDYGVDGQLGLEKTPEEYVAKMVEVFREVKRVLKADGTLFLNLGDSYYGSNQGRMADGTQVGGKKQMTNKGSVTISSGGRNPILSRRASHAPACDSDGTVLEDYQATGSVCFDLCDECRVALSNRNDTNLPQQSILSSSDLTVSASPSDCEAGFQDASTLVAPASTIAESSSQLLGLCSHCANCGACLLVLRSSSRDARLCVRRAAYNSGNGKPLSDGRNLGKDASGMACLKYTLKPKDLVGIPWRVAFALQADGWYLRSDIIWHKPNPMPESVTDRPTKSHEYLFLLSKQERYYYDAAAIAEPLQRPEEGKRKTPARFGGADKWVEAQKQSRLHSGNEYLGTENGTRNKRTVWTVATSPYAEAHFATFPPKLIEPCILAGCPSGGLVLDPFAGSGTTIQVAQQLGRQGVGIELNPAYITLAETRTAQGGLPL